MKCRRLCATRCCAACAWPKMAWRHSGRQQQCQWVQRPAHRPHLVCRRGGLQDKAGAAPWQLQDGCCEHGGAWEARPPGSLLPAGVPQHALLASRQQPGEQVASRPCTHHPAGRAHSGVRQMKGGPSRRQLSSRNSTCLSLSSGCIGSADKLLIPAVSHEGLEGDSSAHPLRPGGRGAAAAGWLRPAAGLPERPRRRLPSRPPGSAAGRAGHLRQRCFRPARWRFRAGSAVLGQVRFILCGHTGTHGQAGTYRQETGD